MRQARAWIAGLCSLIAALAASPLAAQDASSGAGGDSARVIVKLKRDSPALRGEVSGPGEERERRAHVLGRRIGMSSMRSGAALSEHAQVVVADGMSSEALAQRLAQEADVEYAVPDRRRHAFLAPNDPLYASGLGGNGPPAGQWYLRAPTATLRSSINAEAAWSLALGSPSIVVAVLDTGVRYDHPDLLSIGAGGNLLPGYDMVSDVATANDGDGRDADASDPGDWVTLDDVSRRSSPLYQCQSSSSPSSWHGTMTAGLIAARTGDGIGMASVGRTVRVLPVRVLGKCGGYDSDIIAGMRWAAGLSVPGVPPNPYRAQVISMSLGGGGGCDAPYPETIAAINAAGTSVVIAAGNSYGHAVSAPANCPGAIAVAGLRHLGTKVGYSDLGPQIAISAPAGNCVNEARGTPCLYPILSTTNTGSTVPAAASYTDAYDPSVGTSFSAPLVAGTIALMVSTQPTLTPAQLRQALQASAQPFPTTGSEDATVAQCTAPRYDNRGNPIDQLECYCTTSTCGAGMLDTAAAVAAVQTSSASTAAWVAAEGLWWNAPAGSESGWGINLAQQGNTIFATWFTYDASGKAWWLTMTADKLADGSFSGTLYQSSGPAFDAVPFDPNRVKRAEVGTGTLTFTDSDNGSFAYTVNGVTQVKPITRQVFGTLPRCVWGAVPDLSSATNYQDLWWAAPAGSESGWGVNFTHQGDVIFATWFTYDADGSPLWLSATATKSAPGVYGGTLYRTTGPAFGAPFDSTPVMRTPVGALTITFASGNSANYAYTVALAGPASSVTQTKSITRQVFVAPGTDCQ